MLRAIARTVKTRKNFGHLSSRWNGRPSPASVYPAKSVLWLDAGDRIDDEAFLSRGQDVLANGHVACRGSKPRRARAPFLARSIRKTPVYHGIDAFFIDAFFICSPALANGISRLLLGSDVLRWLQVTAAAVFSSPLHGSTLARSVHCFCEN